MFTIETARRRAAMMARIRDFFRERNVMEVETPLLCHGALADCHIDLFVSEYVLPGADGRGDGETVYLQSSPEMCMKRLLSAGFPDVYQIGRAFRNGELGRLHNPEFTMLEWYRIGFDMRRMIDETVALLEELCEPSAVITVSYRDLFLSTVGIDPLGTSVPELTALFSDNEVPPFTSVSDGLVFTMAMKIEPAMRHDALTVVHGYPADQAVLSRLDDNDSRVARRFEMYFRGMELANGFEELTDTKENEARLETENRKRLGLGKTPVAAGRFFSGDIAKGMPRCSGVAVGLDRVMMATMPGSPVEEVVSFGWKEC